MFERFYRAHIGTPYDYGGLGVGLYISREIARQHGGDIWFESEEGKGSTFHFSLPLAPD
jgi:signal transduction histidine kinase